jgi:hypothetical protein
MTPSRFIEMIVATFGTYPEMSLGCLKFGLILCELFDGRMFYNSGHIMTKIGDKYYDQNGVYDYIDDDYLPVEEYGLSYFEGAFSRVPDVFHLRLKKYFGEE